MNTETKLIEDYDFFDADTAQEEVKKAETTALEVKKEVIETEDERIRRETKGVVIKSVFGGSIPEFEAAQRMCKTLQKSDMLPAEFGSGADAIPKAMIAYDMALRLNLSPYAVMKNIFIVKSKNHKTGETTKTYGWKSEFILSLVIKSGRFTTLQYIESFDDRGNIQSCYCKCLERETGIELTGTMVTMAMAKAEGWTRNSKWNTMPQHMLRFRAVAFFARTYCPEYMCGLQATDEHEDVNVSRQTYNKRNSTIINHDDDAPNFS